MGPLRAGQPARRRTAALLRPGAGKCSACLPLTGLPPAPLLNRAPLRRPRPADPAGPAPGRRLRHGLAGDPRGATSSSAGCGRATAPSSSPTASSGRPEATSRHAAPLPARRCASASSARSSPTRGSTWRCAAFRGVDPARATLDGLGRPAVSPAYTAELAALASPAVRLAGRFDEERRSEIFAGLDVLIVPSLGLESFGLVAREALAEGVPVLAARRGALAELFDGRRPNPAAPSSIPRTRRSCAAGSSGSPRDPEIVAAWAREPAARSRRWTSTPRRSKGSTRRFWRRGAAPHSRMIRSCNEFTAGVHHHREQLPRVRPSVHPLVPRPAPGGKVCVLIVDRPQPGHRYEDEPFAVVFADQLGIPASPTSRSAIRSSS